MQCTAPVHVPVKLRRPSAAFEADKIRIIIQMMHYDSVPEETREMGPCQSCGLSGTFTSACSEINARRRLHWPPPNNDLFICGAAAVELVTVQREERQDVSRSVGQDLIPMFYQSISPAVAATAAAAAAAASAGSLCRSIDSIMSHAAAVAVANILRVAGIPRT